MILPLTPAVSDPVGCDIAGIPVGSPLKSPSRPSCPPVSSRSHAPLTSLTAHVPSPPSCPPVSSRSALAVGRPPARARAQSNPAQALASPRAGRST